ncbi:BspA family leucine-rich repeat surface protein [archaeon]|nr:MAG: BspA family leucine-rich repeat surface protein [archaeon]
MTCGAQTELKPREQYCHISTWNTNQVTIMDSLLESQQYFNDDFSMRDASNATSLLYVLYNASSFNQPTGDWDVSRSTTSP